MLYTVSIVLHLLVAVLGIGLVGAIPITARFARRSEGVLIGPPLLRTLLRAVRIGVFTMFLTGVLLDLSAAGVFHSAGWFRASLALLVVVGIALARARTALRRDALDRVERWGWVMCATVALITILMRTKMLA